MTMWEAIAKVFVSTNALTVLICIIGMVILLAFFARIGLLNIHTSAVEIGAAARERNIMRQQNEWIRRHFEAMESTMDKPDPYNEWRGKYVAERVYDEYVEWIMFNHISKSPAYIEIKQDRIVSLVNSLTELQFFHSEEFEDFLRKDTKECIEKLIQIRNVYK